MNRAGPGIRGAPQIATPPTRPSTKCSAALTGDHRTWHDAGLSAPENLCGNDRARPGSPEATTPTTATTATTAAAATLIRGHPGLESRFVRGRLSAESLQLLSLGRS